MCWSRFSSCWSPFSFFWSPFSFFWSPFSFFWSLPGMFWLFRPSEPFATPFSLELICLEFFIIISMAQNYSIQNNMHKKAIDKGFDWRRVRDKKDYKINITFCLHLHHGFCPFAACKCQGRLQDFEDHMGRRERNYEQDYCLDSEDNIHSDTNQNH